MNNQKDKSENNKIPKIIHYCWFGQGEKSELIIHCIDSWKKYCPDYEIIEWNETNFDINCCKYVSQAYEHKKYAFVSDYCRFFVLYNYGGVYLDTDVELLKPISDLPDTFVGFEHFGFVASGLIRGANKGDKICKLMLESYNKDQFILPPTTVCIRETEILKNFGLIPNNKKQFIANTQVYPTEYFCPLNYVTKRMKITKNTYSIHWYGASWLQHEPLSFCNKFKDTIFRLFVIIFGERFALFARKKYSKMKKLFLCQTTCNNIVNVDDLKTNLCIAREEHPLQKKNVGIISLFFRSYNYGGMLQAYALQHYITKLGYDCMQIAYDMEDYARVAKKSFLKRLVGLLFHPHKLYNACMSRIMKKLPYARFVADKYQKRAEQFDKFADSVPHTEKIYRTGDFENWNENFDTYITGSDQVWNPEWYRAPCFLNFVKNGKKISYAASIGQDTLSPEQKKLFADHLASFSAVSVREENAVDLLSDISPQKPIWVLDPTLLLTRNEWEEVTASSLINEPYIFCYFLGIDKNKCSIARQFAKCKGLKLVTVPYLLGYDFKEDRYFGDYRLFEAGPREFLSLIKNADYVLTDSFHACIFSYIFKKQYFVFPRDEKHSMEDRIISLLKILEQSERFCDTQEKMTLNYMKSLSPVDYTSEPEGLTQLREVSQNFLKENI